MAADGPDAVRAELVYRLRPAPGTASIPVRMLPLPGARPAGLTARVWEDPAPVRLVPDAAGMLVGAVPLPEPTGPDDVVVLRLRYRISRPAGGHTRVPLPAVPWPPVEAVPGSFTARVDLPPGATLEDGFPATWSRDAPGAEPAAAPARWRAELPVLPAMVSFRAAGGDGVTAGLPGPFDAPAGVPSPAPGFVFWGLFAVFGAVLAAYVVWMLRVERAGAAGQRGGADRTGPPPGRHRP